MTLLGPDFPTSITNNSANNIATSLNLVIATRHAHLNIHLEPGRASTSNQLRSNAILRTNPIQIPSTLRFVHKRADWNMFKKQTNEHNHCWTQWPTEQIEPEWWFEDILSAKRLAFQAAPLKLNLTPSHLHNYKNGWEISLDSWSVTLGQQHQGRNERCKPHIQWKMSTDNNISNNLKDPNHFWQNIKTHMGEDNTKSPYLLNTQN